MAKTTRPLGIVILVIVALIAGIGGAGLMVYELISPAISTLSSTILLISYAVGAVVGFISAYGLWAAKKWGWWLSVIEAAVGLITILTLNIITVIISVIMLYYLTKKSTKQYFGM